MKIALAQLNYHIGNLEANTQKIIQAIEQAKQQKADLIVFAELAICGYPPLDLLEFTNFIDLCEHAVEQIAGVCDNIASFSFIFSSMGSLIFLNVAYARPLFISVVIFFRRAFITGDTCPLNIEIAFPT